jgi:hypothetical protein
VAVAAIKRKERDKLGTMSRPMLQTITSGESYIFLAVVSLLALVALIYLLSPISLSDEPLIYLIGVNHAVQFKSAGSQMFGESVRVWEKREAFKAHVAEMIDKLDIEILAEEFSQEAKREGDAQEEEAIRERVAAELGTAPAPLNWKTVLEQFSEAKRIGHRFCDPDSKERKALGIEVDPKKETESDWRKREQVWLTRVLDCKDRRVLFVCGDNHYDAFAQLLESNGFNVRRGPRYDISNEEFEDPVRTTPDV